MKKILHVSNYYPPSFGGIEQTCKDIVNTLKGQYKQIVICFNHEKNYIDEIVDGIRVVRVGYFTKFSSQAISFSYKKILKKIIEEFNPDYIHFHYPNPLVSHFLLPLIKKRDIKLILHWHLDITKQKIMKIFFEGQNEKLLNRAYKIIATSPNYLEGSPYLSKYREKVEIIPSTIDVDRLKISEKNLTDSEIIKNKYRDKTICLYLGRHVEHKGLRQLIEASKYLTDDFIILVGGSGPLTEEMKKLAKNDKKVVFLGRISDDEYKSYLLASDIFTFPSYTKAEAFGLALAEAMYFNLPAVTFNIPGSGVNYVCVNNVTGL